MYNFENKILKQICHSSIFFFSLTRKIDSLSFKRNKKDEFHSQKKKKKELNLGCLRLLNF